MPWQQGDKKGSFGWQETRDRLIRLVQREYRIGRLAAALSEPPQPPPSPLSLPPPSATICFENEGDALLLFCCFVFTLLGIVVFAGVLMLLPRW